MEGSSETTPFRSGIDSVAKERVVSRVCPDAEQFVGLAQGGKGSFDTADWIRQLN